MQIHDSDDCSNGDDWMFNDRKTIRYGGPCRILSACLLWGFLGWGAAIGANELPQPTEHLERNPVYRYLVTDQPAIPRPGELRLPKPVMGHRLTAGEQMQVLERIAGNRYDVDDLMRPSVVAPFVLELDREAISSGPRSDELQTMDLHFVGQGNLDAISDREFLSEIIDAGSDSEQDEGEGGSSRQLSQAELSTALGSDVQLDPDHESYNEIEMTIFDRIHLSGVGRTFWSRTDDSIVLAMTLDPRFNEVEQWASQWERFQRQENGRLASVQTGRFSGGGIYLKITQLKGQSDRLFIEVHGALIEPYDWFRGANLLGSKLPPTIQSQVRDLRRRSLRAMAESAESAMSVRRR